MQQVFGDTSAFVTSIRNSTVVAPRRSGGERSGAELLLAAPEQLASLAEHAFWATLAVEEGRPVRGLLCVTDPTADDLKLSDELPVSVPTLTRLLTAAGGTALGVHQGGRGQVAVWGFTRPPDSGLRLRLVGPGHLVMSDGQSVLAVARHGEILAPKLGDARSAIEVIARLLRDGPELLDSHRRAKVLLRIAMVMRGHGHGGAIIVGPHGARDWLDDLRIPYEFDAAGAQRLVRAVAELQAAGAEYSADVRGFANWKERFKSRLLVESIRDVGRMTAVDGAVVMDESLAVHGFGAKMQPAAGGGDFHVTVNDSVAGRAERDCLHTDLGGMRHQSAARFVNVHHDCAVIVASQDDRVTCFMWDEGKAQVVALQGLEHSLWDYEPR